MKKLMTALAAVAAAFALSAPASATVVGGIDFGATTGTHLETATLAETFVSQVGDTLEGYGYITTVNGSNSYCAVGPCALYYHVHDYVVSDFNGLGVRFTGGYVDVYYAAAAPVNLLTSGNNSVENLALITSLTPWARLTGHTFGDPLMNAILGPGVQTLNGFGTLTGASLSQSGAGQLDTDTSGTFGIAAVTAFLDGNGVPDNLGGFADIVLTSSSNNVVLNQNDIDDGLANGCLNGTASAGAWCLQGTANIRGVANVVPEPAGLALVGLGLLAAGFARRRTTKQ